MLLKSLKKLLAAVALVAMVPAFADVCTPNDPVVVDKTVSGRIIANGYVNTGGAVVCFDDGHQECDSTLPKALPQDMKAGGQYSITLTGDVAGKRLIVKVPSNGLDNSGQFTANVTLAAIVTGAVQNITPFTTVLATQADVGKTPNQALTAVRNLVGSSTFDPQTDYVANPDPVAAQVAKSMVWNMIGWTPGSLSSTPANWVLLPWRYEQAVFNAYAAVGNVDRTTLNDALLQMSNGVVDASTVLANSLYDINGDLLRNFTPSTPSTPSGSVTAVREKYVLDGSTLSVIEAGWINGAWTAFTPIGGWDSGSTDPWKQPIASAPAVWVMKTDGTWLKQPTGASLRPTYAVTANGSSLSGVDSLTGDTVDITYHSFDASNLPLSISPKWMAPRGTMVGTFAQGSVGYVATFKRAHDQVVLTTSGLGHAWYNGAPHSNTQQVDSTWVPVLDKAGVTYTSVLDAVGTSMTYDLSDCYLLTILPNNTFTIDISGYNSQFCKPPVTQVSATFPVTGTWSVHPLNSQVIQLNIPKEMYDSQLPNSISSIAAKYSWPVVIAFYQGHLLSGFMKPASVPEVTRQFSLDDSEAVRAAMITAGSKIQYPPQNK